MSIKVRYGLSDMTVKVSNITPFQTESGCVLITASDINDNELIIEMTRDQAEMLEAQLREANRRSPMSNDEERTTDWVSH